MVAYDTDARTVKSELTILAVRTYDVRYMDVCVYTYGEV